MWLLTLKLLHPPLTAFLTKHRFERGTALEAIQLTEIQRQEFLQKGLEMIQCQTHEHFLRSSVVTECN